MSNRQFYYRWLVDLKSDPQTYWPLITDTNRFNRDTGLPALENLGKRDNSLTNARRRLRFHRLGIPLTWVEEPFEWVRPHRFGVLRKYSTGPVQEMRVLSTLAPLKDGGTRLTYEVWASPRNLLGLAAIPIQIGLISANMFRSVFRKYDDRAASRGVEPRLGQRVRLVPGGGTRLARIKQELQSLGVADDLATRLMETISREDDFEVASMRPYALADKWDVPRKSVLEMFLYATRVGLVDLSWHLLCPSCRVAKETSNTLRKISAQVHCDTCLIDFDVNFDQSVELTFRPNPTIREIPENTEFCIAGPQTTPHIIAQQLIPPYGKREIRTLLEKGRYRLRILGNDSATYFQAIESGQSQFAFLPNAPSTESGEPKLAYQPTIEVDNLSPNEILMILEHVAWGDKSVTAAEVTALQTFRDLFANEALRPGDQFSVGRLAVVFTDLRQSTRMYRDIGDAPAFGHVMDHFDILRSCISSHNGALVKTIGDAVMAVFRRPIDAFQAIAGAQSMLVQHNVVNQKLELKAGLHFGPCIAVNLNDRLDYFGTTVNLASRLVDLSDGQNLVLSEDMRNDPEVSAMLDSEHDSSAVQEFHTTSLKGFEDEVILIWKVRTTPAA